MPTFAEVTGSLDSVMGVKAVWGRSSEPIMCFGSRGDKILKNSSHFQQARVTAEKAISQPYLVTIGGGADVPVELRGRLLELVRVTGVYGETQAFVRDPSLLERLTQWPVAVVLSEVYRIEGEPHLIENLGFADKGILNNAFDSVRRDPKYMAQLWNATRSLEVVRRWDIEPLPNFRDPEKVQLCSTLYPNLRAGSAEGKRVRKEVSVKERDPKIARAVKEMNRAQNGGNLVCEGCDFIDQSQTMFDAHHLDPLGKGPRWSSFESFAVLCPTCHRWCHHKAADPLQPLSIATLRATRSQKILK
jgi:5-methylcytosine-specific restriction enzyme A